MADAITPTTNTPTPATPATAPVSPAPTAAPAPVTPDEYLVSSPAADGVIAVTATSTQDAIDQINKETK
jgi:hypothetical protein